MNLGRIGVWRRRQDGPRPVPELESLGYGAVWVGASPSVDQARPFLEAADTIVVATGILNLWQHDPGDVAAAHAEADARLPRPLPARDRRRASRGDQRLHAPAHGDARVLRRARRRGVPREERIAAALGPKMLDLAAERSLGAHPYFTPVEHTRFARERVGPNALVAPEVAVVVEADVDRGRELAREYAAGYLRLTNYTSNLLRLGFTEEDIAGGGSDRLIDAVIPHGSPEAVAEAVQAHFDAGADHVCLQPLGHGPEPLDDYRALARVLL